jgi:hypothetical protein
VGVLGSSAPGSPESGDAGWRRLSVLVVLTAAAPPHRGKGARPPDGDVVGTWWMGQYEEPLELDLA